MTNSGKIYRNQVSYAAAHGQSFKCRLLQCAAASAAAWALLPTAAHAAIPPECDEEADPRVVTCVLAAPGEIGQVISVAEDQTVIIGSEDTPTTINVADADQDGVHVAYRGDQTLIINAGSVVRGDGRGVLLSSNNLASGAVTFQSEGSVTGETNNGAIITNIEGTVLNIRTADMTSNGASALVAQNLRGTTTAINSVDGILRGRRAGLFVTHDSTGPLRIATGDIVASGGVTPLVFMGPDGGTVDGDGIYARITDRSESDSTISTVAGDIRAFGTGIDVGNNGTGSLVINAGNISSADDSGIRVRLGQNAADLTIDTTQGSIQALVDGISVSHLGSGTLSIRSGDVRAEQGPGIAVSTGSTTGDVSIDTSAGSITGGLRGVSVVNSGVGDTRITTADVSSEHVNSVFAFNLANAGSITIDTTAGTIQQGLYGIDARNEGTGSTRITTADVNAALGIRAITLNSLSSLDTRAGTVSANAHAIFAEHAGSGALFIQTGDLSGANGSAIIARNLGGDETVINTTDGSVSAAASGIQLEHTAPGGVEIQTADVTAGDSIGISVQTSGNALSVDSVAGTLTTDGTHGIQVVNTGTGNSSVRTADVLGGEIAGVLVFTGNTTINSEVDTSTGSLTASAIGISHLAVGQGDGH